MRYSIHGPRYDNITAQRFSDNRYTAGHNDKLRYLSNWWTQNLHKKGRCKIYIFMHYLVISICANFCDWQITVNKVLANTDSNLSVSTLYHTNWQNSKLVQNSTAQNKFFSTITEQYKQTSVEKYTFLYKKSHLKNKKLSTLTCTHFMLVHLKSLPNLSLCKPWHILVLYLSKHDKLVLANDKTF